MVRQSVLFNFNLIRRHCRASICLSRLSAILQNPYFHTPPASRSYSFLCGRGFDPPLNASCFSFSNSFARGSHYFNSSAGDPDSATDDGHSEHFREGWENVDPEMNVLEAVDGIDPPLNVLDAVNGGSGDGWLSPVRALVTVLDGAHELTGLPWWLVIITSTLFMRIAMLPVLVLHAKKVKEISQHMGKLPPPFPPPFSGKSFLEQLLLFRRERRAIGCPSLLWSFTPAYVQIPCFILWMFAMRRMSLDGHPGFDTGGILWFQNLTECPHGISGLIFPLSLAVLHATNVQLSFRSSVAQKSPGTINLLFKYYKLYLEVLTLPIFVGGFFLPQGSLLYWMTNSSFTLVQNLSFKHLLRILGLYPANVPSMSKTPAEKIPPDPKLHPLSIKHPYILQKLGLSLKYVSVEQEIDAESLPPDELLDLSLHHLAAGDQDRAFPLLRLAVEKDPELARSSIAMGLLLFSRGLLAEAADYFVHAISKIRDNDASQLVIASFGAGVSLVSQPGRELEGIEHLKRIASLKEPDNPVDKHCYFQGLVMLGSALFNQGQKVEAVKHLRRAAAYDPSVNAYVEECERNDESSSS